jgi:hypothetical protein
MHRPEVNLKSTLISILLKDQINMSNYVAAITEFERKCEISLVGTFNQIGVHATVKTDPYSLPYKDEIVIFLPATIYANSAFEFFNVARKIIKQLLNDDIKSLRFYFFINLITSKNDLYSGIEYRFRYSKK